MRTVRAVCGRVFVSRAVASSAGDVCPTRLGVVRDLQFAQAADSYVAVSPADAAEAAFLLLRRVCLVALPLRAVAVPRNAIIDESICRNRVIGRWCDECV